MLQLLLYNMVVTRLFCDMPVRALRKPPARGAASGDRELRVASAIAELFNVTPMDLACNGTTSDRLPSPIPLGSRSVATPLTSAMAISHSYFKYGYHIAHFECKI